MQILKITGMDWGERRLSANCTCIRTLITTGPKRQENVKIGRGVRQGCCLLPVLFKSYIEYLTKEAVKGVGDCKIREWYFAL
jgi:hypothetical protein